LPEEWEAVLRAWGEPRFRAVQVFRWIHRRGVLEPEAMTDLPRSLRTRLAAEGPLAPVADVALVHRSSDGTRKLLVRFGDGREVETVLLPQGAPGDLAVLPEPGDPDDHLDGDTGPDEEAPDAPGRDTARARSKGAPRATADTLPVVPISQCISTQVGCAMGCVFCASGVAGLKRNLSAGEIVAQVLLGRRHADPFERVRNVVLMGMGEPLHNYDAVARALVLLTHPEGAGLSSRRVTLSTSGLVPQIDRLGADFNGQVQLAVSLHAVTDERRSALMPVNRKHPLDELMACLRRYPLPRRRRITIEYTLIAGKNDDVGDAERLADLLEGIPAKVNLIPMNPVGGSPLVAPDPAGIDAFQARLRARGVAVFVRRTRGDDIAAACGQLALRGEKRKLRVDVTAGG
jgi:23S rRNA (adenine2503-C2)-methyltransferase